MVVVSEVRLRSSVSGRRLKLWSCCALRMGEADERKHILRRSDSSAGQVLYDRVGGAACGWCWA